jgi:DNA-binding NtrC family response regulator
MTVLIIDDDASVRSVLENRFVRRGHTVLLAESGEQALRLARAHESLEVAITDLRMPGLDGFAVLKQLKVPTIIVTGHGDKESAIRAVELGAFSFFEKPFDLDSIEIAARRAAERHRLELERLQLLKKLEDLCKLQHREIEHIQNHQWHKILGESQSIMRVREILKRLGTKPKATVLITGESGTGKEVAARELHELTHAQASSAPFVALNCAAIPPDLLESELYGHEKGSFSGALNQKIGLAEAARDGTLFLDEIGDMDPRHQAKLLRLLQERKFRRVGANNELTFNGRIVAATHRNLEKRSAEGLFREDLFYRLSVVAVELPPLRERGSDVLTLGLALCAKHGLNGIAPERVAELRSHNWPGNIRELNNWIERGAILGEHDADGYLVAPLPGKTSRASISDTQEPSSSSIKKLAQPLSFDKSVSIKDLRAQMMADLDKSLIQKALGESGGNISAASKLLGIDRKNLGRRLKELGLEVSKLKKAA